MRYRTPPLLRSAWPWCFSIGLLLAAHPAYAEGVWEIDTYGNGDMLKGAMDAIVAFSNVNGGMTSAIKLITLAALIGGLISAGAGLLTSRSPLLLLPYTILTAGMIGSLSVIPATVVLHDQVALTDDVIDNVPLPIAAIGHMTSSFGQRLTQQIEQAIQPADVQRFTSTGLGWGPRVIQATLKASPADQALLTDLDAFIRLCVIPDINMGYKTAQGMVTATTVDDMLGDTNPAIAVLLPSQCKSDGTPVGCTQPPPDQRCPDAYSQYLSPRLTQAATDPDFLKTIAVQIGTPYSQVLSSIGDVHNQVLKISQDGANLLKLRFVANQLLPSVQAYAAIGGQSATLTAWSLAEAQNQQVSSWLSTGLLLQQTLPIFHAALEFLFYAFMMFGIPLIVIRPRMLIDIASTALWLQLWPLAYVFGNLFLYKQLDKISFMTDPDGLNLGLSYTTTQPLMTTIQSAYAASGFPVMIGIMMIGGMIFGGGFALTKAVSMGPFGAGAGYGTAAALGNVSMGNVGLEQRNLAPRTQLERDGFIDTVYGNLANPTLLERRSGSFTQTANSLGQFTEVTPMTGGGGSATADLGGGMSVAFNRDNGQVIHASLPINATTRESALSQAGSTLTSENATVQQRTKDLQNAQASNLDKTFTATSSDEASTQYGISKGTREAFQTTASREISKALQNKVVGEELRQHFITDRGQASLSASAAPSILGFEIGPSGQMAVSTEFVRGDRFTTTLSKDTSSKVLSQAQESLGHTKEYQALQQEVARHGDTSSKALGFSEVQRTTQSYNDAVSKRDSVATTLQATEDFVAQVGTERGHLLLNALWDARHPDVNFMEAVKHDTGDAQSFAAYLRGSLSTPEGLQDLATEARGHLRQTGQFDRHLATEGSIELSRPDEPSAAGLTPVANPLPGSGFAEPVGHRIGQTKQKVDTHQATTDKRLAADQHVLQHEKPQVHIGVPTRETVSRGIQDRQANTEGGALTAAGEVAHEVALGTTETAKDVVVGIGGQFSAMYKSLQRGSHKPDEQAGSQTLKAQ